MDIAEWQAELRNVYNKVVNHKKVKRVMRENGLLAKIRSKIFLFISQI